MAGDEERTLVDALWARQSQWSQAANRLKRQVTRARFLALWLTGTAAVLGAVSANLLGRDFAGGRESAFGAAAAAALAPVLSRNSSPKTVRDWTRLRSVSEALKSEIYMFLAGAGPYRGHGAASLLDRIDRIDADAADLEHYVAGIAPVIRTVPAVVDTDSYVRLRVRSQIDDYYRPRARKLNRRVSVVRRVLLVLSVLAALLSAAAGAFNVYGITAWIPVTTTVAAAVAAYAAAAKYEYESLEFTRTADQLERLTTRWQADGGDARRADDALIEECERVISIQNEAWMVKVSSEE